MIHNQWSDTKPEFTDECLLIIANDYSWGWEYIAYVIRWTSLEGSSYMGWFDGTGEEYGSLPDLKADRYFTLPLLK